LARATVWTEGVLESGIAACEAALWCSGDVAILNAGKGLQRQARHWALAHRALAHRADRILRA